MTVPLLDNITVQEQDNAPDLKALTTKNLDGTGIFDVLMTTVKLHLNEAYTEGLVTRDDFAHLYTASIDSVLKTSINHLMNLHMMKKVNAEIGLVRQQTATELAQTDNTIPNGLAFNDSPLIEGVVASKLAIDALQESLLTAQVSTAERERDLVAQQIITELGQTSNTLSAARAAGLGYNTVDDVQGAMTGAASRSQAEADLAIQKLVTELAQTSDTKPNDLGQMTTTAITGIAGRQTTLLTGQANKATNESVLVAQKTITELSQTSDALPTNTDALNTNTTIQGQMATQLSLNQAQTDGFARDAEQKLLRIMADVFSVNVTMGKGIVGTSNGFDDASVLSVVNKAKTGISV